MFVSKVENGEFDLPSAENIKNLVALLDCKGEELPALAGIALLPCLTMGLTMGDLTIR